MELMIAGPKSGTFNFRVPGLRSQGLRVPGSQVSGPRVSGLRSHGLGSQGPGSQGPGSQGPRSRVSGPHFRLCHVKLVSYTSASVYDAGLCSLTSYS